MPPVSASFDDALARPKPLGFRPLEDRLVLRPVQAPERTASGRIIVPDSVRARITHEWKRGIVMAIGPGMTCADGRRWPMPDVQVGDTVIYDPNGAQKIMLDDVEYHSVRDDFVHAVEEP